MDVDAVGELLGTVKPAVVVYLARPDLGDADALDAAVLGVRRFALACAGEGVERVIFASSAAVYGTSSPLPRRENERLEPGGSYALLKLRSELALADVAAETGMSTTSLRIFNAFGPGLAGSLVNRLALGVQPVPVVHLGPDFVRDYVHSSDVARAVVAAVVAPAESASVVNIGSGHGTSNDELLDAIQPASFVPSAQPIDPSYSIADISLARAVLGYEATVTPAMAAADPDRYLR